MDEVGLSTRHGSTPVSNEGRSTSRSRPLNGHLPHLDTAQNGFGRPPYSTMTPQQQGVEQGISPHLQRTVSMDSTSFDPYMTPQYTHSPAMSTAGASSRPTASGLLRQSRWHEPDDEQHAIQHRLA